MLAWLLSHGAGRWAAALIGLSGALVGARPAVAREPEQGPSPPAGRLILGEHSNWRCHLSYGPEAVRQQDGALQLHPTRTIAFKQGAQSQTVVLSCGGSEPPPPNWNQPDFDDGDWLPRSGPLAESASGIRAGDIGLPPTPLHRICFRGRFRINDPRQVKALELSLAYRGGVIVYLNGIEVARGHLSADQADPTGPAEDYPPAAYVDEKGDLIPTQDFRGDLSTIFRRLGAGEKDRQDKLLAGMALRIRHLANVRIAPTRLRQGVNVLAVEVRRPPTSHLLYTARRPSPDLFTWPMIGLESLGLSAAPPEAAMPNTHPPEGVHVFNAPVMRAVLNCDWADPNQSPQPIELFGARNGRWSGQLVVQTDFGEHALAVSATDLDREGGGGSIPASAVQIRYALPTMGLSDRDVRCRPWLAPRRGRNTQNIRRFDGLEDAPPRPLPGNDAGNRRVQPVWITVAVPPDAAAGDYRGTVTVRVDDTVAAQAPLIVHVAAFALPDPRAFASYVELVQSPRTLALQYAVPMWSARHWELIDAAFALLGQVGTSAIYVPLLCNTHHGNADTMVRWVRAGDGYTHDFTLFEKYLDTAVKHLGKDLVVGAYVWDPVQAYGNASVCIPVEVTRLDPATGAVETMPGPAWDAPDCLAFWKPVFEGLNKRLADRGMAAALTVGVAGQGNPTPAIPVLNQLVPQAGWITYSHYRPEQMGGKPTAVTGTIYQWPGNMNWLPARRYYGWNQLNPRFAYFPRQGSVHIDDDSSPVQFRMLPEILLVNGFTGFGWLGADFWPVLTGPMNRKSSILRANWNQLSMGQQSVGYLLHPGPNGPCSSVRFEMLREGLQEAETRVFIEKALLDPAARAALGEELAGRCQELLDQRVRALSHAVGVNSRRPDFAPTIKSSEEDTLWYMATHPLRTRRLYATAAEVAARNR